MWSTFWEVSLIQQENKMSGKDKTFYNFWAYNSKEFG